MIWNNLLTFGTFESFRYNSSCFAYNIASIIFIAIFCSESKSWRTLDLNWCRVELLTNFFVVMLAWWFTCMLASRLTCMVRIRCCVNAMVASDDRQCWYYCVSFQFWFCSGWRGVSVSSQTVCMSAKYWIKLNKTVIVCGSRFILYEAGFG